MWKYSLDSLRELMTLTTVGRISLFKSGRRRLLTRPVLYEATSLPFVTDAPGVRVPLDSQGAFKTRGFEEIFIRLSTSSLISMRASDGSTERFSPWVAGALIICLTSWWSTVVIDRQATNCPGSRPLAVAAK